jgi:maltose O-acetyltransferase
MKCPYPDIRKIMWKRMGNVVGDNAYINHSITILDSPNLEVNIVLGNRVALSPNIIFITYSSPNDSRLKDINSNLRFIKEGPITVGDDTWIGAGTIIHPGIKIGQRCIIGSMSNVTKDIPDDSLAYGNPAIIRSKLND